MSDIDYEKLAEKITNHFKHDGKDGNPICAVGLTKETADILNELAPTLKDLSNYWNKSVSAIKWLLVTAIMIGLVLTIIVGLWHQFKNMFISMFNGG